MTSGGAAAAAVTASPLALRSLCCLPQAGSAQSQTTASFRFRQASQSAISEKKASKAFGTLLQVGRSLELEGLGCSCLVVISFVGFFKIEY